MLAPPTTQGVVGTRLGLHSEKLSEEYPVGFDPQEGFTEVDEDRGVEDTVGVEVEALDAVVLQEPLEEIACWERKPALREPREHGDLIWILLHGIRISRGGAPHVDFLLPKKSTIQQRKQIFNLRLRLLPLLVGIWARRRHRRRCPCGRSGGFLSGSLLPAGSLQALGRRGLHSPSAPGFHSHSLGGGGALGSTISSEVAVRTGGGF
jgi:hypothetical protein